MEQEKTTPKNPQTDKVNNKREQNGRRMGTLSLGVTFILCGVTLLINLFYPAKDIWQLFRLYPIIFIMIGIEIIVSSLWADKKGQKVSIDGWSIFILFMLIGFCSVLMLIQVGGDFLIEKLPLIEEAVRNGRYLC